MCRCFRNNLILHAALFLTAVADATATVNAVGAPVSLSVPPSDTTLAIAVLLGDAIKLDAGMQLQLVPASQGGNALPAQLVPAIAEDGGVVEGRHRLAAVIPAAKTSEPRRFSLQTVRRPAAKDAGFTLIDLNDKSIQLLEDNRPVWVYNHGPIVNREMPASDGRRVRACYMHPVWGLRDEVLTADFPTDGDHRHQHGIFWAWPHVIIDGADHNLWIYSNIRQKFVRWLARETGPVAAVLAVENGWFVDERKVMVERVWMRSYRASADSRALDLEFTWIPVDRSITLRGSEGKGYGGLVVRFAVLSPKDTEIIVPAGTPRQYADRKLLPSPRDLNETQLPWSDLSYPFAGPGQHSGAALFVRPDNPDPPLGVTRHYGALCAAWPGTAGTTLPPGKPVRLCYRVWIHKNAVDAGDLERAYAGYVAATKVHPE